MCYWVIFHSVLIWKGLERTEKRFSIQNQRRLFTSFLWGCDCFFSNHVQIQYNRTFWQNYIFLEWHQDSVRVQVEIDLERPESWCNSRCSRASKVRCFQLLQLLFWRLIEPFNVLLFSLSASLLNWLFSTLFTLEPTKMSNFPALNSM